MQPDPTPAPSKLPRVARVELFAIPGLAAFEPGDDLAAAIYAACSAAGLLPADGDIVVVAQKVVSKCEGAYARLGDADPSPRAQEIAAATGKDPRLVEIILADTSEVLRARAGVLIVANRAGQVMANGGVDSSNLEPIGEERVLRLPFDADHSAMQLKLALETSWHVRIGVVINDSWGRAWRNGTVGHAVGTAGFAALWDRRGEPDMFGRVLRVTEIGFADEIAAAASLVMGAAGERQPVVIVRGLEWVPVEPQLDSGAGVLIRDRSKDLFR